LRTQQIIAHETGVANTPDPFGGSYFVERLTLDMEHGCWDYFKRLDALGGMVAAIEQGFPQREIEEASYAYQKAVEERDKIIVGVNDFVVEDEPPLEILLIDESVSDRQAAKTRNLRATRDNAKVASSLDELRKAAAGAESENLVPFVLAAVRCYATLGEICDTLRGVFGSYREPSV
jgi:methylmalonyl-CoA mutase N-terminal domain/subunit